MGITSTAGCLLAKGKPLTDYYLQIKISIKEKNSQQTATHSPMEKKQRNLI
jgi:hypothetical protein